MSTWLDYLIAILIIVIGSLFGPIGFVIAIILVAKLADGTDFSRDAVKPVEPHPAHHLVEQSIEAAWRNTDQTTVPPDMLLAYRRYLKSEPWYALRRIVLKRDGHRCTRCGYIGNLQVHHINYVGIYENFNFSVDQLESICYDCHNDVHKGILPMKKE